jgi:hypothetical protein
MKSVKVNTPPSNEYRDKAAACLPRCHWQAWRGTVPSVISKKAAGFAGPQQIIFDSVALDPASHNQSAPGDGGHSTPFPSARMSIPGNLPSLP